MLFAYPSLAITPTSFQVIWSCPKVIVSEKSVIKIVKNCKAGISNDTGCGHLISSTGTPTLTLFGPTDSEKFSPIGNPLHVSISSQKTFKSKNINAIPVNLVLRKLKTIIDY